MYFYEWGYQWAIKNCSYEESLKMAKQQHRKPNQPELDAPENVAESVSASTFDNESIYTYNKAFLDVRTPNDEKRGPITAIAGSATALLVWIFLFTTYFTVRDAHEAMTEPDVSLPWDYYVFSILSFVVLGGALYVLKKYIIHMLRLEMFTARRLIIRFNRITRKVYLLRPNYLGGLRIMDWDKTQPIIEKKMTQSEGMGGFVVLCWDKGDGTDLAGNSTDDIELTFVGKPTRNARELLAFWEYIRRYMEDGPEAAPPPKKLISKFPWPWLSFKAAWGLDTSFLRHSALWVFVLLNCMLLPAILIHAVGHWVSLLLCYEPRFPKAIENAGRDEAR